MFCCEGVPSVDQDSPLLQWLSFLYWHPYIPQEQKDFSDWVFVKEGDIFEGVHSWFGANEGVAPKRIFEGLRELKSFHILGVPDQVISRVANVVATTEKASV